MANAITITHWGAVKGIDSYNAGMTCFWDDRSIVAPPITPDDWVRQVERTYASGAPDNRTVILFFVGGVRFNRLHYRRAPLVAHRPAAAPPPRLQGAALGSPLPPRLERRRRAPARVHALPPKVRAPGPRCPAQPPSPLTRGAAAAAAAARRPGYKIVQGNVGDQADEMRGRQVLQTASLAAGPLRLRYAPPLPQPMSGTSALRSVFCLAPSGGGWGIRIVNAMLNGCIPVIIQAASPHDPLSTRRQAPSLTPLPWQDGIHQPGDDVLPYLDFSARPGVSGPFAVRMPLTVRPFNSLRRCGCLNGIWTIWTRSLQPSRPKRHAPGFVAALSAAQRLPRHLLPGLDPVLA